jgi:hypothetical protein
MASAALVGLKNELNFAFSERLLYALGFVSNDYEDARARNNFRRSSDHVGNEMFSANGVEHFGMTGLQPCAFAGGENDNGEVRKIGALTRRG